MTQNLHRRPPVNCSTCENSRYIRRDVHFCNHESQNRAVAGTYNCKQWRPMILPAGPSTPPEVFGAMHTCPSCRV